MLSTHWRLPNRPSQQALRLLDLFIRQVTDFIERSTMDKALRDADRRKDEFLAMLGHELRNPLATVTTGMTLLQSRPSPKRRAQVEQMVTRQAEHMRRLVDDLLDVGRITQGKIQLRRELIALSKPLKASVEAVQPLLDKYGHEFSVLLPPEPVFIMADSARMEQILTNILANAAKYTPPGGRIALSAERLGAEVIIRCRDNGVGIAPDMPELVFEPSVQINPSFDRAGTGLGMGLTLARKLAELHGGTLAALSAGAGSGTEFALRLPVAAADQEPASTTAKEEFIDTASHPKQILVIDDNRDLAESLSMFLQDAGHRVFIANDGETGVAVAEREQPDFILLDLGLPGIDGYAAAEKIRAMPALQATMIIAISGYKSINDERTRRARFDAHLVKPIAYDHLMSLLQKGKGRSAGPG